ncbi:unnamed protein product [Amoebophrya sp. A120]|nr:unnamed protein product [Amoebophrya sp. A120]|eukprot:GSA120T00022545001.1
MASSSATEFCVTIRQRGGRRNDDVIVFRCVGSDHQRELVKEPPSSAFTMREAETLCKSLIKDAGDCVRDCERYLNARSDELVPLEFLSVADLEKRLRALDDLRGTVLENGRKAENFVKFLRFIVDDKDADVWAGMKPWLNDEAKSGLDTIKTHWTGVVSTKCNELRERYDDLLEKKITPSSLFGRGPSTTTNGGDLQRHQERPTTKGEHTMDATGQGGSGSGVVLAWGATRDGRQEKGKPVSSVGPAHRADPSGTQYGVQGKGGGLPIGASVSCGALGAPQSSQAAGSGVKPTGSTNRQNRPIPGDWQCPRCGENVFASNVSCFRRECGCSERDLTNAAVRPLQVRDGVVRSLTQEEASRAVKLWFALKNDIQERNIHAYLRKFLRKLSTSAMSFPLGIVDYGLNRNDSQEPVQLPRTAGAVGVLLFESREAAQELARQKVVQIACPDGWGQHGPLFAEIFECGGGAVTAGSKMEGDDAVGGDTSRNYVGDVDDQSRRDADMEWPGDRDTKQRVEKRPSAGAEAEKQTEVDIDEAFTRPDSKPPKRQKLDEGGSPTSTNKDGTINQKMQSAVADAATGSSSKAHAVSHGPVAKLEEAPGGGPLRAVPVRGVGKLQAASGVNEEDRNKAAPPKVDTQKNEPGSSKASLGLAKLGTAEKEMRKKVDEVLARQGRTLKTYCKQLGIKVKENEWKEQLVIKVLLKEFGNARVEKYRTVVRYLYAKAAAAALNVNTASPSIDGKGEDAWKDGLKAFDLIWKVADEIRNKKLPVTSGPSSSSSSSSAKT